MESSIRVDSPEGRSSAMNKSSPNPILARSKLIKVVPLIVVRLIWVIIIATFGFFTIESSATIFMEFINEEINSLGIVTRNTSVTLPSMTCCVPIVTRNMFKSLYKSKDEMISLNYTKWINFKENNMTQDALLNDTTRWTDPFLFIAYRYLACITHFEFLEEEPCFNTTQIYINDAVTYLEKQLGTLNMSTYEFRQRFGKAMAVAQNLHLDVENVLQGYLQRNIPSAVTYISLEKICYSVPIDQYPYEKGFNEGIHLTIHPLDKSDNLISHSDYPEVFLDISGRRVVSPDDMDDIHATSIQSYHELQLTFTSLSIHHTLSQVDGKVRCSEAQSLDDCRAACKADYTRAQCNCTSTYESSASSTLIDIFHNSRVDECSLDQFMNCLNNSDAYDKTCEKNCVPSCKTLSYTLSVDKSDSNTFTDTTRIHIYVAEFDSVVFEEIFKWNAQSFLGAFGGALGLWLGLDCITVLRFATATIAYAYSRILSSKLISAFRKTKPAQSALTTRVQEITPDEMNKWKNEYSFFDFKCVIKWIKVLLEKLNIQTSNFQWTKILWFAFWVIVYITQGYFAHFYLRELYQEYLSDKTISVAQMTFNDHLVLRNSSLCIEIWPGDLDLTSRMLNFNCGNLTLITVDLLNTIRNTPFRLYNLETTKKLNQINFQEMINYFNHTNPSKEFFLNEEWPRKVLHIVHNYLFYFTECEINLASCLYSNDWYGLHSAMQFFETKLSELNISYNELSNAFGQRVATLLLVSASHSWITDTDTIQQKSISSRFLFVDEQQICYELGLDDHFLRESSKIDIYTSTENLHTDSWVNFSHSVTLSQGKVAWPVVDNGEIRDGHLLSVLYGHEISATFDIITIINMRNEENGIVKCSSEWSKRDCLAQCYSSNIKALCNCSAPMLAILFPALALLVQSANSCTLDRYYSCENITKNIPVRTIKSCARNCTDLCEIILFDIVQKVSDTNLNSSRLTISINKLQYPVFNEEPKWTLQEFLGAFGGIIGFFLGLDFLQIFMYIYILFLTVYKKCRQKRYGKTENGNDVAENDSDVPIGQLEMESNEKLQSNDYDWHLTRLTNRAKRWRWKQDFLHSPQIKYSIIIQWLVSNLFKIILIVVFGWLTLQMLINFAYNYSNVKTVSVTTFELPTEISLPISTACIDLRVSNANASSVQKDITNYFKTFKHSKETFLNRKNCWPDALLSIVHCYLVYLTDNEASKSTDLLGVTYKLNCTLLETSSTQIYSIEKDLFTIFVLMEENLQKLNVTVHELRQKFGSDIYTFIFPISITCINGEDKSNIPLDYTTSVSSYGICYQIPLNLYPFQPDNSQLFKFVIPIQSAFQTELVIFYNQLRLDFTGGNMTGLEPNIYTTKDAISINIQDKKSYPKVSAFINMEYVSRLSAINGGIANCNERNTSMDDCLAVCRVQLISEMCGCSPTSWPYLANADQQECKLKNYTSCLKFSYLNSTDCSSQCIEPCNGRYYHILEQYTESKEPIIEIQLRLLDFFYPSFKEELAWTFETVSSELGNIFGFYLGLDIITILQLVGISAYHLWQKLFARFTQRDNNPE